MFDSDWSKLIVGQMINDGQEWVSDDMLIVDNGSLPGLWLSRMGHDMVYDSQQWWSMHLMMVSNGFALNMADDGS